MNTPTEPSCTAPDKPQFAVWPYLNQYLRGGQELPRAKCYDGRESWELLSQESLADRGQPFRTEEQVLDWRQGAVIHAEPERVPVYALGTKEELCQARSLTPDEFAQQFTPTSQPNVYQNGWRPGRTNAILRLDHCPYYGPVMYLSEAAGPNSTCTLRRFWPYKRIETPTFEIADLIEKEFDNIDRGVINDPQCCLGADWDFRRIEQVANGMQGHQFDGLRFQSYQQRIAAAAYDLDEALSTVHSDVLASARASFWRSYEVHRHLGEFVRRLTEYAATLPRKAKTRLDDPQDAFLCAQTQIATFARVLAQTRPPAADLSVVANTTKPAEPKRKTRAEWLDQRAAIDESTQEEQIDRIGISLTTYYSFRRGNNVSNITLGKFAAYLGCDVADLKTQ